MNNQNPQEHPKGLNQGGIGCKSPTATADNQTGSSPSSFQRKGEPSGININTIILQDNQSPLDHSALSVSKTLEGDNNNYEPKEHGGEK